MRLQGALINGLETRVSQIESQLSDLDARGSEEHDNLANERELHRFILTGKSYFRFSLELSRAGRFVAVILISLRCF